jgi:hypothetical protein
MVTAAKRAFDGAFGLPSLCCSELHAIRLRPVDRNLTIVLITANEPTRLRWRKVRERHSQHQLAANTGKLTVLIDATDDCAFQEFFASD